jgi:hypothetical protein
LATSRWSLLIFLSLTASLYEAGTKISAHHVALMLALKNLSFICDKQASEWPRSYPAKLMVNTTMLNAAAGMPNRNSLDENGVN